MTVAETTSIDQVAAQDGRLLLAMTEVRSYANGDSAKLVEEFRVKLNTYVYAVRSGQVDGATGDGTTPTGYDIVLFCPDEPPHDIQETIRVADAALAAERVTVRWRILDSLRDGGVVDSRPAGELTVDELPLALAQAIVAALPAGWTHGRYQASVIVGRSQDELAVRLSDGTQLVVDPPARVRELVPWLKHRMFQPGRGTWLSATFTLVADGKMYPEFSYDQEPGWARPVDARSYAEELEAYPRPPDQLPAWWTDRIS